MKEHNKEHTTKYGDQHGSGESKDTLVQYRLDLISNFRERIYEINCDPAVSYDEKRFMTDVFNNEISHYWNQIQRIVGNIK